MSRLSKNITYNILGQGLLLVLSFVVAKNVFGRLGADALGLIYFTLSLNAVLTALLDMGISSTVVREVAGHYLDEPRYIEAVIRTASLLYWTAYFVLAAIVYLGAPLVVDKWISLTTLDAASATHAVRVLGVAALFTLPQRLYASMFRGLQRMEVTNFIDVGTISIQQLGVIAILSAGGTLLHVVHWLAFAFGIGVLVYIIASARFFSAKALIPGYAPLVVRRNIGYSSNVTSISILAAIHTQSDKLILSRLVPIGTLGYYGFAYNVAARPSLLVNAISQAVFPAFSELLVTGDRSTLMAQYRKLQDLVCLVTVPVFAAIPFGAVPLFTYVFGGDTAGMLLLPTTFLCIGFYMNGTLTVPYFLSLAAGRPGISVRLNLLALLVVLPVTIALVRQFSLVGAGLSWVFYNLFAYAYAIPRICSECLSLPPVKWYMQVGRILFATGVSYGTSWAVAMSFTDHSTLAFLYAYLSGSVAFAFVGYRLVGGELKTALSRLSETVWKATFKIA